jgi:hypothetical protein
MMFSVIPGECGRRVAAAWLLSGVLMFGGCGSSAAKPAEYRWVLSEAGVGPIAIGMRSDDLQGVIDTLGRLGECVYAKPLERPAGVLIMLVDGVVARVDVTDASTPTDAGARVGDTEARITGLYPSARVGPHKYTDGHYLTVDVASGRRLVFETDGTRVTRLRSGAVPAVDWVEGCS